MLTENETRAHGALAPEALGAALAATSGADDWQVETLRDEEAQIYLIGDRVEAVRTVTNERARVTIHNDHTPRDSGMGERARGMTTVTLLASDASDPARLAQRLSDAVTVASLTDNPPFGLPEPPAQGYPSVQTVDPALEGDVGAALQETMARLRAAAAREQNVRLSSAELFVTQTARTLRNSRGVAGESLGTRVMLDFVLIARGAGGREAEFHGEFTRRRLEDLLVEGTVAAYATFARHSLDATTPPTYEGPVVLSGEAIAGVFNPGLGFGGPYSFHTSAEAAYLKLSRLTPGEAITGAAAHGDRLTVLSDPLRPFGMQSNAFDGEGLPAARLALIEEGVLARRWADTRYATYMGVPATGAYANVTVLPGTWDLAALRSATEGPVYEIVAFSFMNPDPISGDFVAEIKLGYRHGATGTQPIKGGSLAGNVFAAFEDARLSHATYSDGTYYGPAAVRFGSLTIARA
jgi:predicted Zn-dependent protease